MGKEESIARKCLRKWNLHFTPLAVLPMLFRTKACEWPALLPDVDVSCRSRQDSQTIRRDLDSAKRAQCILLQFALCRLWAQEGRNKLSLYGRRVQQRQ